MTGEHWEYLTTFVWAETSNEGAMGLIQERWPWWKNVPKFTAEALIPMLNEYGKEGWELVSMEPVFVLRNGKVWFTGYTGADANSYFCALKRRLPD